MGNMKCIFNMHMRSFALGVPCQFQLCLQNFLIGTSCPPLMSFGSPICQHQNRSDFICSALLSSIQLFFFRVVRPIPENSSIGSSQIFFKPRHQGCKYLAGGDSRYQGCDAASGCDHQICHCGWNNHFRYRACSQHSGLVVHKEGGTAFEFQ